MTSLQLDGRLESRDKNALFLQPDINKLQQQLQKKVLFFRAGVQ